MKKLLLLTFCNLFLTVFAQEQETTQDPYQPHTGFQFSLFAGGMIGDIKTNIADLGGKVIMKGSRVNAKIHLGYAYRNWAGGFSFGNTSMSIKTMEIGGVAYKSPFEMTIDNSPVGFYLKRHFMPINIFICTDLGVSKFSIYDNKAELQGETDMGFAWNISVGKEFLLGKRKRIGLGGYVNLAGLYCRDQPPFQNDNYSYVSPGMGIVFSYR